MAKKKTTRPIKSDRKPIGVCYECGEAAYKRVRTLAKDPAGRDTEIMAPYCYRHAQQLYRSRQRGHEQIVYERLSRSDWSAEELELIWKMRHLCGLSFRQIGRALEITHTHARRKLKEAEKQLSEA
jgi:hypothetical protein